MRIVRYRRREDRGYGVLVDGIVRTLEGGLTDPRPGEVVGPVSDVELLAPCEPKTVVCASANYAGQIAEKGIETPTRPGFFLKSQNAVIGPNAGIYYPRDLRRLEYEGELAIVISRPAQDIAAADFADYVLGYTCANDITADDYRSDGQWYRAKSSDTFCPLGPWIETEITDPSTLNLRTLVNGDVVQDSSTSDMVFGVHELLAWVTRWFTLEPGDVVLSASPAGVGPLSVGDQVEVEIEQVGRLQNHVSASRPPISNLSERL